MGEAAAVIAAFHGGVVACQDIVSRYSGAVGEGGAFDQIDGIGPVVSGDLIPVAENGNRLIVAVDAEQALIHQGEQCPVGIVFAFEGVQRPVCIIGKREFLRLRLLVGNEIFQIAVVIDQGIAGGDIGGILGGAAGKGAQRQAKAEHQGQDSFHTRPSLHTMIAP